VGITTLTKLLHPFDLDSLWAAQLKQKSTHCQIHSLVINFCLKNRELLNSATTFFVETVVTLRGELRSSGLLRIVSCYYVLYCVITCCIVLLCVVSCYYVLYRVITCCIVLLRVVSCYYVLYRVIT
jgi:hypothetical protein